MEYLRQSDGIRIDHSPLTGQIHYTWSGGEREIYKWVMNGKRGTKLTRMFS
jgi:hypothetical protein